MTEHLRTRLVRCACPRHLVGVDDAFPVIVLVHREDCDVRHPESQVPAPPVPRPAREAIPCPVCGNVAFSRTPAGARRCDGPAGCGHVWEPREMAA